MRVGPVMVLSTTLILVLLIVAVAQGIITVVYPDGTTRTIPKTPYIEASTLYVGKFAMKGRVVGVTGPNIIHVEGVGYVKLADILVPSGKADQAEEYLVQLLGNKTVYLDIDDKNIIDQSGRISAVVYLPIDNTTVLNVNFDLVLKGYAYIFNEANEFNPSKWTLKEKLSTQEPTTTTTTATSPTATTTITVTSVIPLPGVNQTTPAENETPENQTLPPPPPTSGGGIVVIEQPGDTNLPPPPPATTSPPVGGGGVVYTTAPSTCTPAKTVTTTVTITYRVTTTIQRYLTFTLTTEGQLPFHATPLGISLIAALSALLGSFITIALLRKYITA